MKSGHYQYFESGSIASRELIEADIHIKPYNSDRESILWNEDVCDLVYQDYQEKLKFKLEKLLRLGLSKCFGRQYQDSISRVIEPESIDLLISGCFNMINFLIEKHRQGQDVETILFLDKSARNGAFLLMTLFEELQKNGELSKEITKPKVRFINIGQHDNGKHDSPVALKLLAKKFEVNDFVNQKVLVVDEFVDSSKSIRRALKTIEDVFKVTPEGIALFKDTPGWYDQEYLGLSGVADNETRIDIWDLKNALHQLKDHDLETFLNLFTHLSKEKFVKLLGEIENIYILDNPENLIINIANQYEVEPDFIDQIIKFRNQINIRLDPLYVWEYFDTCGGFFVNPLNDEILQNQFALYRFVLMRIIKRFLEVRNKANK